MQIMQARVLRFTLALTLVAVASVLAAIPGLSQPAEVRLAVTDLAGMEQLQVEFGQFQRVLSEKTGFRVTLFPVNNRTAAVEALNAKKIDFVLTGPAEYVVFRKRTNAQPVIGFSRPEYYAQIVVLAEGGVSTPADLRSKKVAFGDIGSTSAHLGPMQVLADHGLDPRKDIQPLHVSRNVAVEALKRGDIAAIGMNRTHLEAIREKDPTTAYRVIARGRDLPDDLLIAGAHVDPKLVTTMRQAFIEHSRPLIDAIVASGKDNRKYVGMHFIARVQDSDYAYVRAMYATIGFPQFAEFVGQ
jgi:phosphonate transport system substrate-binding protein